MATAEVGHIVLDDHGVPLIAGTTTKVVEVIEDFVAWGWGAEKIHEEYPDLSLAKIHAAFTYYYDHQAEIDAEIERRDREFDEARAANPETSGRKKLRDLGLRP